MSPLSWEKGVGTHDTRKHFIQHSTKTPPIDLIAIWKTLNNLGCNILTRSTERASCVCMERLPRCRELFIILHPVWHSCDRRNTWRGMRRRATGEFLGKPKISEYDVAIGRDKDILWLKITIDDARGMQAFDTLNNFGSIEAGAVTPEAAPAR